MKLIKIVTIAMLSLICGLNFTSCQNTENVKSFIGKVAVNEFEQKLNESKNAQLIDVRTPEEYVEGHLQNASNIDYRGSDFDEQIKKLDKSKPVFVYCLSGGRSGNATEKMKSMGFKEIYDLKGGINAWKNADKPLNMNLTNKSKGMTMNDFMNHVKSGKLVLVDFNATWCGPCRRMAPFLEEISNEQKDKMELLKIDDDENSSLAKELKIEGLPTLILYKNGKEVWKQEGFIEKEDLIKLIQSN
jgi:thioredoxin 1